MLRGLLSSARRASVAALLGALLPVCAVAAGQAQERTIKKLSWRNEPVKLSKLKVRGRPTGFGQKFLEEDDWLKDMVVTVKNTSEKTITFIDIAVDFPRTEAPPQEPPSRDHLLFGQYPLPAGDGTPTPSQASLPPGQSVELRLMDYEGTREFLRQTNYPVSIKQVEVSIDEVIFSDGLKWSGGRLFRRDPGNPERWNVTDEQQSSSPGTDKKLMLELTLTGSLPLPPAHRRGSFYPQFISASLIKTALTPPGGG